MLNEYVKNLGFKPFASVNGIADHLDDRLPSSKDFIETVGAGYMAKKYLTVDQDVYDKVCAPFH